MIMRYSVKLRKLSREFLRFIIPIFLINRYKLIRAEKLSISQIVTKHFCKPSELPHRKIVEHFFNKSNLKNKDIAYSYSSFDYMNCQPISGDRQFYRKPSDLMGAPEWWVMPWANMRKDRLSPYSRKIKKDNNLRKYINLLDDVENNGFRWTLSGPIRVHLLIKRNGEVIAINLDGHHRLALLSYLIDHKIIKDLIYVTPVQTIIESPPIVQKENESKNLIRISDGALLNNSPSWFELAFTVAKMQVKRHSKENIK